MRYEEFVKEQVEKVLSSGIIGTSCFPDIELYMDQTSSLFRNAFKNLDGDISSRFAGKPMLSNYLKNDLIAKPDGKKYSGEHYFMIAMVIYLRGVFKIDEIKAIMKPMIDNYNSKYEENISAEMLFSIAEKIALDDAERFASDVDERINRIKSGFEANEVDDDQRMESFVLILSLVIKADMEIYLAKRLAEVYFAEPGKIKKEKKPRKDRTKRPKNNAVEPEEPEIAAEEVIEEVIEEE